MTDYRYREIEPKSGRKSDFRLLTAVAAISAFAGGALVGKGEIPIPVLKSLSPGCNIKGNISIDTGERIYHVPGQMFYMKTTISTQYGEQWFCSEDEARKAGWRRSKR